MLKFFAYFCLLAGLCGIPFAYCGMMLGSFAYVEQRQYRPLAWSPDGKYLAFGEQEEFWAAALWVIEANGDDLRYLSGSYQGQLYQPEFQEIQWSEDGQQIFYQLQSGQVFAIPFSGGEPLPVTLNELPDHSYYSSLEAQSVCNHPRYEAMHIPDECPHDLEVRDKSGKLIFSINQGDMVEQANIGFKRVQIISVVILITGIVLLIYPIVRNHLKVT